LHYHMTVDAPQKRSNTHAFLPFSTRQSLLHQHDKTVGGDDDIQPVLARRNGGTKIADVISAIYDGIAVEDLPPAGIRNRRRILLDQAR
jgi:hypothetical protein